jgi:hypothetical protein
MGFAINPAMNHIDIPEAYVHELYRSSAEVLLPDARFHGHTCEAYICIAKIEKTVKAYVALLETGMKTVFVFTSELSVSEPSEYPEVYKQAEAFVKKMGFTVEPINLGFSPAMREVIIKGFRVMRPPPEKKPTLRQAKAAPVAEPRKLRSATPRPPDAPVVPVTPAVSSDLATELESLQRELASAKAAIAKITREKVSLEQNASVEIASLKSSCAQAMAAKESAEEQLAAETQKLIQAQRSRESSRDDEDTNTLRVELKAAADAASRSQEEIAALQQKLAQLETDNQALQEQLTAAAAGGAEQARLLTAEKETLLARIASKERAVAAAADRIATLERFEISWQEGQQREEELCRDLDTLHARIDSLSLELQTYKDRGIKAEELQLEVNRLQEELATAQAEIESLSSREIIPESVVAELKALQENKLAVEAEYVRLANESREMELEMHDALAAAEQEIERLTSELDIQAQVATMAHEALRAELRKLVVNRSGGAPAPAPASTVHASEPASPEPAASLQTVAAPPVKIQRTAPPPAPVAAATVDTAEYESVSPTAPAITESLPAQAASAHSEPVTVVEVDDEPDRPIVADKAVVSKLLNEFGGFSGSNGTESTEFSVDPNLTAVEYSDLEEIEVLLYSINTVQAVPDSSSIQRCKGYVVATNKEGNYKVYVAWYLTESKRVVICTPQQQPADSEDCVRILQDAVAYFEIVGFMMEIEDLGESVHSYNRAIKKSPVFRRNAKAE